MPKPANFSLEKKSFEGHGRVGSNLIMLLGRWIFLGNVGVDIIWVVVSNIFYFHPYLGKISTLTNIFQMG